MHSDKWGVSFPLRSETSWFHFAGFLTLALLVSLSLSIKAKPLRHCRQKLVYYLFISLFLGYFPLTWGTSSIVRNCNATLFWMLSSNGILDAYRVASGQFEYLRNHQELSNVQRMKEFPLIENYNSYSKGKTQKLVFRTIWSKYNGSQFILDGVFSLCKSLWSSSL
jgi:hypothetical protein